jgi:hypothetical protein
MLERLAPRGKRRDQEASKEAVSFIRASCGTPMSQLNAAGMEFAWRVGTTEQSERAVARRDQRVGRDDGQCNGAASGGVCRADRADGLDRSSEGGGWMDRDTPYQQIASVRDGADLLEQLAAARRRPRRRPGPRRRAEVTKSVAAAWSTHPVRNIVSRCRPIPARTLRTVRRQKCGRQKRW